MDLVDVAVLVAAGLAAGTINAVAGGGSLVTYPTLLAIGLSPVPANVTNSIAVSPGYVGAVLGSRPDLAGQGRRVRPLLLTAAAGSAAGCVVLLLTPEDVFGRVVPFLVLAASGVLAGQDQLRRLVGRSRVAAPRRRAVTLHLVTLVAAFYGGYFGAALGVMLVALLGLVLEETLARVSALKNLISAVVGLVTVAVYAVFGPVEWLAVLVVAPATVIGGYLGARFARRLPHTLWKLVIVGFGLVVGTALLISAYA